MIYRSYTSLFSAVKVAGRVVDSRLGPTKEMLVQSMTVPAGTVVSRPKMNLELGFVEMLMLLGGTFDVGHIAKVAPKADLSLFTESSAYGPRLAGQIAAAIRELKADPSSRRVVLLLPMRGEDPTTMPCTTSIQLLVRQGVLHAVVSMRSWDLWLGAPYDLMMFGGLTLAVARVLGLASGAVTVTAGSAHIYEQHWDMEPGRGSDIRRFSLVDSVPTDWQGMTVWAREQLDRIPWPASFPEGVYVYTPFAMIQPEALP